MHETDTICDLECMKGGTVHEFVGPVKIILMDPPNDDYNRRQSGAAFAGLANMMIGANVAIVTLFVLGFKLPKFLNWHIILCTVGYQFCMPSAILMMNSLNGPAAPLKKPQRKREHLYLNVIGLICGISGSVLVIQYGEQSIHEPDVDKTTTVHFYFGCGAAAFSLFNTLLGPVIYFINGESSVFLTSLHRIVGMIAFLLSSVCFVLGIVKPSMQLWLFIIGYLAPTYLILFFTTFYTLVVLATPLTKLVAGINY